MQRSFLNSLLSCVPVLKRSMRVLVLALACSLAFTSRVALSDVETVPTGPFDTSLVLTNLVFESIDDALDYRSNVVDSASLLLASLDSQSQTISSARATLDSLHGLVSNIYYRCDVIDELRASGQVSGTGNNQLTLSTSAIRNNCNMLQSTLDVGIGQMDKLLYTNQLLRSECQHIVDSATSAATYYSGVFAVSSSSTNGVSSGCSCPDYSTVLASIDAQLTVLRTDASGILANTGNISVDLYHLYSDISSFLSTFNDVYLSSAMQRMLINMRQFWLYAMESQGSSTMNLGQFVRSFLLTDQWGPSSSDSFLDFWSFDASYFWYSVLGLAEPSFLYEESPYGPDIFLIPLHSLVSNFWYSATSPDTASARSQVYDSWSNTEPSPQQVASEAPLVSSIGLLYRIQHLLTTNIISRKSEERDKQEDADDAQSDVEDAAQHDITMHSPFDLVHGFATSVENLDQAIQAVINAIQTTGGLEFVLTDSSGVTVQLGSDATRVGRSGIVKIVGDSNAGFSRKCLDVLRTCFTILWYALAAFLAFSLASWVFRIVWTLGSIAMQCIGGDFSGVVELVNGLGTKFAGEG